MDKRLLQLLVCPITKQHLLPVSEEQQQKIIELDAGVYLPDAVVTYLVTGNQHWAYPVVDGVPWLMESKRISLS